MKNLFLFLALVLTCQFAYGQGDAPPFAQGQAQTTKTLSSILEAPNYQVTKTSGSKSLVESGNKNILANPSFEHSTATTSWTNNGTEVGVAESTVVIDGKKSLYFNPSNETINLVQSSTLYQAQFADGVQGLAMVRIKSAVALSVCSVQAGVVSTTNCVTTNTDSKWGLYKIPFILGATSNGISIAGSALTGAVYVDDCFVGAVDLKQDINVVGPWVSFTPTGSWVVNTTYTGKWRQVGENAEIQFKAALTGAPTAAALTFNMPTGLVIDTSKLEIGLNNISGLISAGTAGDQSAGAGWPIYAEYQGSTSSIGVMAGSAASTYTARAGVSNLVPFTAAANDIIVITATVPIVGFSGASSAYTARNADTEWAACTYSSLAWQGLGTVTNNLKCRREGASLKMMGSVTFGTTAAAIAQIMLPTWNGTQLTSASSLLAANPLGDFMRSSGSINTVTKIIGVASSTFMNMSNFVQSAANSPLTAVNGNSFSTGETFYLDGVISIPIASWTQSNIIIGSFNEVDVTPGVTKPKTCHYAFGGASATLAAPTICAASPCVEVYDSCGTGTPPTRASAGVYNAITFAAGTFAANTSLKCDCLAFIAVSGGYRKCTNHFITAQDTWMSSATGGYIVSTFSTDNAGSTAADSYIHISCKGQAP